MMAKLTLIMVSKSIAKLLGIKTVPKQVENYFLRIVKQNIDYRESNNVKRNDFMQLLIDLKSNSEELNEKN